MRNTDCTACAEAAANPRTGMYCADCVECAARALAQSPEHHDAHTKRRMTTAYVEALKRVFGDDWLAGHMRVKAWAERIDGVTT